MKNTTETGRRAEVAAAGYLEMRGFTVLELNWRRPRCEIDIVAQKGKAKYFVEVKYRKNDHQGGGLEAITATKVKQMRYGAETWMEENKWRGECHIAAIEIAGPDFVIMHFIEDVL